MVLMFRFRQEGVSGERGGIGVQCVVQGCKDWGGGELYQFGYVCYGVGWYVMYVVFCVCGVVFVLLDCC